MVLQLFAVLSGLFTGIYCAQNFELPDVEDNVSSIFLYTQDCINDIDQESLKIKVQQGLSSYITQVNNTCFRSEQQGDGE